ncbi:Peptidase C26 [Rhodococcus sp. RD6.2]|jgi:putative glutamine amidotransferase|uniref:gamma-glutamyl-gamma-aminobutyrate hydrolase family protein n=1 Tax=Rhodococcus sp. RD6.2 TaxID=260936 RepID=UPI00063BCBAA|nr:gamma-glutamyl-gamma-aminobutyrate hydrolase family protein [Rhodococcus sp. RD6.2]CRK51544.1 Peptidase C26 [Rhodococcus sp. RD6.2]
MAERPVIAMTVWRRELPTYLGDSTDLFTVGTEYVRFFASLGVSVVLVPDCTESDADTLLSHVSGLVLTGGEDVGGWIAGGEGAGPPTDAGIRDRTEHALVAAARKRGLPVFGICRGMQLLAAMHGSRVVDLPASRDQHPYGLPPETQLDHRHDIVVDDPRNSAGPVVLKVNSIHQQAVSRCPDGFRVSATAPDGTIEAIESTTDWYAAGVQWHPEKMCGTSEFDEQMDLVRPFVDAIERYRVDADTGF